MTRERCLDRDLRRFEIADLADHYDVRILAQDRTKRARKRELDARTDLGLRDAVERVLDRILHRHHVRRIARQSRQRGIERRRLA